MNNKDEMIKICKSMVSLNEKSTSVFALLRMSIWQKKLKYWLSVNEIEK